VEGNRNHILGAAETRVALVQRSCGYADRPTLALAEVARVVRIVRAASPRCLVLVDNCYGEFTEAGEPCSVRWLHNPVKP
jgi:cystathionine beta-lyase family protein involved in aluminum resistance